MEAKLIFSSYTLLAVALIPNSIGAAVSMEVSQTKEIHLQVDTTTPLKRKYIVDREWKGLENGNQIHHLVVQLIFNPMQTIVPGGKPKFEVSILRFSGRDLDKTQSKHLKSIAKEVQKNKVVREFGPRGAIGISKMGDWNYAGWAGMMADKAIGLYEIGFLDLVLPKIDIHVGSQWTADWPFGDEGIYDNGHFRSNVHDVRGNIAHVTYRLKKIDLTRGTATVTFFGAAHTTMTYDRLFKGTKVAAKSTEMQFGEWVVNLKSGLPESFIAQRRLNSTSGKLTLTDGSVTKVALLKKG